MKYHEKPKPSGLQNKMGDNYDGIKRYKTLEGEFS